MIKPWMFAPPHVMATGGTITYDGDYKIHTFLSSGNFIVTAGGDVEYLVVAGGGGGGANGGSGGGAGGLLYNASSAVTAQTYAVTVGAGGTKTGRMVETRDSGVQGANSSFVGGDTNIVAIGGGYGQVGGSTQDSPGVGGSGGGAAMYNTTGTLTGAAGTNGQGYKGGNATNTGSYFQSAGGGGAGGAGGNPSGTTNNIGGVGGAGLSSSITGAAVTIASGGSGYQQNTATLGGGGATGANGTENTGGGGGTNSAGGSGIVIVRYKYK